jgi:allantoicase
MYDGWETARNPNRPSEYCMDANNNLIIPGNEWAVIQLGAECHVQQVVVETMFFKGNYPESFKMEAMNSGSNWFPLVERSKLEGNKQHSFQVAATVSHVKLTIYPDGGISRIRILGIK